MNKSKRLKIGDGIISGYLAIFLSILCLLGVLTTFNPSLFTTQEFRGFYKPETVRLVLLIIMVVSLIFSLISYMLSHKLKLGSIAIVILFTAAIFGLNVPEAHELTNKPFTIGLDWLVLDILISAVIFIPIELFFPKRTSQTKFHSEWRTDLVYFIVSHLLIQITGVIIQLPAVKLFGGLGLENFQAWVQNIHYLPQLFLALIVADLFQYSGHYIFHKIPFLWRFHAIHHSTKNLDWLAGSRTHFFDLVVVRAVTFLPIYVFGFSSAVFNTYIIIVALQAVLAHSNTRINFGFLRYVFVTPQYHHWHHSDDPKAYDKNFAIHLPIIDMIFGTYYHAKKHEWPEGTGLGDAHYPKGFLRQLIYPFQKDPSDPKNQVSNESDR